MGKKNQICQSIKAQKSLENSIYTDAINFIRKRKQIKPNVSDLVNEKRHFSLSL